MKSGGCSNSRRQAALCVAVSLLLHSLLFLLPEQEQRKDGGSTAAPTPQKESYVIRLQADTPKEAESKLLPVVKTDPDIPQSSPERADFEGRHNSTAEGNSMHRPNDSTLPIPSLAGEKQDELVTFDMKRQDGPLEHDGRKDNAAPPQPSIPEVPAPEQPHTDTDSAADTTAAVEEAARAVREYTAAADEGMKLSRQQRKGKTARPRRPLIIRDPSLADNSPPGFRTNERRSRSTGRFVMGRNAKLNVAATPRGQYETEIYRRIARNWYATCDAHRGDIIPGSITISLRIDRNGSLRNMEPMIRHGASVSQQAFTFRAIRSASLPPMPENVRRDIIGDLLEIIIEFNFD